MLAHRKYLLELILSACLLAFFVFLSCLLSRLVSFLSQVTVSYIDRHVPLSARQHQVQYCVRHVSIAFPRQAGQSIVSCLWQLPDCLAIFNSISHHSVTSTHYLTVGQPSFLHLSINLSFILNFRFLLRLCSWKILALLAVALVGAYNPNNPNKVPRWCI